jgi:hypothetical protein
MPEPKSRGRHGHAQDPHGPAALKPGFHGVPTGLAARTVMLMVAVRPESSFPGMRRRPPPIS